MSQYHLPTLEPDWPVLGDLVVLVDGTVSEISTGELVDPIKSFELCDLCLQWPISGADKLNNWGFCEPRDLVRRRGRWHMKKGREPERVGRRIQ